MNLGEAIEVLEQHIQLRRDEKDTMPEMWPANHAKNLGIAIDMVIRAAKEQNVAMQVINQIATMPRKTRAQVLANSCVKFLASMR